MASGNIPRVGNSSATGISRETSPGSEVHTVKTFNTCILLDCTLDFYAGATRVPNHLDCADRYVEETAISVFGRRVDH